MGKLLATRRARTGSAVGIDRNRTASVDRWKSCALPLLTLTIDDQPDSSVVPQASSFELTKTDCYVLIRRVRTLYFLEKSSISLSGLSAHPDQSLGTVLD